MCYNANPVVYNASMLKFTIDGRPTIEDIHSLFSNLISQITISTHKHMFRNYSNTFTSENAISILTNRSQRNFQLSMHAYDSSLKLNKDMAKALIQQFIWTRLIENAIEPQNKAFKDKGIWRLTSKGLCVFQDFCLQSKQDICEFIDLVNSSSKLMVLIQIERSKDNDRIKQDKEYLKSLFAIMIASMPLRHNDENDIKTAHFNPTNHLDFEDSYSVSSSDSGSSFYSTNGTRKITFFDYFPFIKTLSNEALVNLSPKCSNTLNFKSSYQQQKILLQNLNPSSNKFKMRVFFTATLCCTWLVNNCTVASNDEAEAIMTGFLKLGWIKYFDVKYKNCNEVDSSKSATMILTKIGMKVVVDVSLERYNQIQQQNSSKEQANNRRDSMDTYSERYSVYSPTVSLNFSDLLNAAAQPPSTYDEKIQAGYNICRTKPSIHSLAQSLASSSNNSSIVSTPVSEINRAGLTGGYFEFQTTANINGTKVSTENSILKLEHIIKDDRLLSAFRDFLSTNFCVESLDFLLDYEKLLKNHTRANPISFIKQRQILEDAYILWDAYLKPGTLRELNIDHYLREELNESILKAVSLVNTSTAGILKPMMVISNQSPEQSLNTILHWFDKVKAHIHVSMFSDLIPRFMSTSEYKDTLHREETNQTIHRNIIQKQKQKQKSVSPIVINTDLDGFPLPPQRRLKETIYL